MRERSMHTIAVQMRAKLDGNRGESITEVLVATLVGGLAALMLALAISASSNMVVASRDAMGEYYDRGNAIAESFEAGGTPSDAPEGKVSLADESDGTGVALVGESELGVTYKQGEQTGSVSVIAFSASGGANS